MCDAQSHEHSKVKKVKVRGINLDINCIALQRRGENRQCIQNLLRFIGKRNMYLFSRPGFVSSWEKVEMEAHDNRLRCWEVKVGAA